MGGNSDHQCIVDPAGGVQPKYIGESEGISFLFDFVFCYCVNCANYLYNSIAYHMHIINMITAQIQRDDIFDNLSMSAARSAVW